MTKTFLHLTVAAAIAAMPLASNALGTNEKGCLVGGAAGGLVGHAVSGNRTLLGAAVGCGAGVLVNKQRVKKIDERKRAEDNRTRYAHRDERAPRYDADGRRYDPNDHRTY